MAKKHKMTTREKLDTSHEVRQWVGLVGGTIGTLALLNPEKAKEVAGKVKGGCIKAKDKVVETCKELKEKF